MGHKTDIINIRLMAHGHSLTTHQMFYTYIISKTNDISFATHPLVIACYELMYCTIKHCDSSLALHVRPDDGLITKGPKRVVYLFDSLYLNKVLLFFDLPTLSIEGPGVA